MANPLENLASEVFLLQDIASLRSELTDALLLHKLSIATAESCTGGLIAGFLTELAGSSAWFERGFVTYSNLSKEEMLKVPEALITKYGAVSKPVAEAMAKGALACSTADLSLAVTGIAGPSGGSVEKPVGTVWFAWAIRDKALCSACHHFGPQARETIRQLAVKQALAGMLALLRGA